MKPATDEKKPEKGTYQDRNRPPKLTINNLPDEVLLEILDSFRQSVDPYDQKWKREHLWLNLAQVCGKWRAVMFASIIRLDLGITVGPEKPGHIKTILSSNWPIFLDYQCENDWEGIEGITGSDLWRMRAVLKHRPDRVREIKFEGKGPSFNKFFKMTNRVFPMLESLHLGIYFPKPNILPTFLRGPDLSPLHHLRRLTLHCYITFASIFDFLSSATALTHLTLSIDTPFGPTPETSLHACLQVMTGLLSLDLTLLSYSYDSDDLWEPFIPEDARIPHSSPATTLCSPKEVVTHTKLKWFRFVGDKRIIKAFVRWLRAPSLVHCECHNNPPTPTRLRFYEDAEEHFDDEVEEHSDDDVEERFDTAVEEHFDTA